MRPQDLLEYLDPATFRPFRITMNSGRTFDVGHPEMIRVLRGTALVFDVGPDGIADRWHEMSLLLIENVRKEDAPSGNQQGNGQGA